MNIEILNIGVESGFDDEILNDLKENMSSFGDDIEFHEMPPQGVQASILLQGMSAIVIVFGVAFVKKLGDKTAEDCYPYFKRGLSTIYRKYFGESSEVESIVLVSKNSKNKAPDTRYSLVLSMYCSTPSNQRVKFLYAKDWSQKDFDLATEKYIDEISLLVNGSDSEVGALLVNQRGIGNQYLVTWDEVNDIFISVSSFT